jgi:imidazolonepropionase-like amidohydrolase
MKRILVLAFLMAAVAHAQRPFELASDRAPKVKTDGNVLIKNATVLTVTRGDLQNTDVLVRGGKIVEIGRNLRAPEGFAVIDATGKTLMPGIVDTHSHRGIDGTNEGSDAIVAEVRMGDVVNSTSLGLWQALASGHTAGLLLHGSANPVGGESVVVKYKYNRPTRELAVPDAPRMIKFALGENVTRLSGENTTRFPSTRMGVEATYRRAFEEARAYRAAQNKQDGEAPRRDLRLETLADILDGKVWVHCHSYRADEMLMMVRLSQEYGFKIGAMQHSLEAYKIAPEMAKAGVGAGMFSDHWGYKLEAYDAIPFNAAICWLAGVNVSINTDGLSGTTSLNIDAGKAMRFGGVPSNEALKMLTINPAKQLGIDHRTGSVEVGKDADFAIFDGHPLSVFSKPWMTLVEGEVYFQRRDAFGVDGSSTIKHTLDPIVYKPEPPLPKRANAYAVRGATVHTVTNGTLENATVVVQDGKITAVGRNVSVPSGATVIDGRGLHVYPGFIDCGTSIGLSEISGIPVMGGPRELGSYQPDLDAVTALYIESAFLGTAAYNGVTMSLTKPSGVVVSGQAGFIRHYGLSTEELGLRRKAALVVNFPNTAFFPAGLDQLVEQLCCDADSWASINLGYLDGFLPPPSEYHALLHAQQGQGQGRQGQGRGQGGPGAGMSPEQMNERIKEIEDYIAKARKYIEDAPDEKDLRMEAMRPYVTGERPIVMQARTAATIRAAVDFAKRNNVKVVLTGAAEAWKEAELLAREKVYITFTPWGESTLSANSPTSQWDPYDSGYVAPGILAKAGVKFGFEMANNAMVMNLPFRAGMACAYGLSPDDAIKALTIWPAEMFGVADHVGSIEVGKDAEFFVCEGDPLDTQAGMRYLFVGGHPAPLKSRFTEFRDKYVARLGR